MNGICVVIVPAVPVRVAAVLPVAPVELLLLTLLLLLLLLPPPPHAAIPVRSAKVTKANAVPHWKLLRRVLIKMKERIKIVAKPAFVSVIQLPGTPK